jgi:RNase P/RNase MRP subunit p30
MRKYCDLHLKLENEKEIFEAAKLTKEMGFKIVGLTFQPDTSITKIKELKKVFQEFNVDLASRVDLKPKSKMELLSTLRKLRRKFEIISVECTSNKIAIAAARDRRVDLINFSLNFKAKFTHSIAHVLIGALEINLIDLITPKTSRAIILNKFMNEVFIAKINNTPVVVSSGATNPLLIRAPREIASCSLLFKLEPLEALSSISTIPSSIVKRNRVKLSRFYIGEGIKIVD